MKKAFSLIMALVMSAMLFVGCAKADEKTPDAIETTTAVSSSDIPADDTPETEATTTAAPETEVTTTVPETEATTTVPETEAPAVTTAATTTAATTAKAQVPTENRITLSGNANDKFIADKYCYAEGERVVIYFEKGIEVRGDAIKAAEQVMSELEGYTGLKFSKNYLSPGYDPNTIYDFRPEMKIFKNVNSDFKKVNIYVVELGQSVAYSVNTGCVVESEDFDFDESSWQVLYHELSHVLHMKNGVTIGSTLNEGFAIYTKYETMKKGKKASWDTIQYFGNDKIGADILSKENAGFQYVFDEKDPNYQYGFRFVTFISETYGKDAIIKIINDATASGFNDATYDMEKETRFIPETNEQMIKIIKRNTSDDVFVKFAEWVPVNWPKEEQEFWDYMKSIGEWNY